MCEGERCENKKSDVATLGRKLKLHLLVYIIDYKYLYMCVWGLISMRSAVG